jgi:hypothetical protein
MKTEKDSEKEFKWILNKLYIQILIICIIILIFHLILYYYISHSLLLLLVLTIAFVIAIELGTTVVLDVPIFFYFNDRTFYYRGLTREKKIEFNETKELEVSSNSIAFKINENKYKIIFLDLDNINKVRNFISSSRKSIKIIDTEIKKNNQFESII